MCVNGFLDVSYSFLNQWKVPLPFFCSKDVLKSLFLISKDTINLLLDLVEDNLGSCYTCKLFRISLKLWPHPILTQYYSTGFCLNFSLHSVQLLLQPSLGPWNFGNFVSVSCCCWNGYKTEVATTKDLLLSQEDIF